MKKLKDELKVKGKINKIFASSLEEAIKESFKSDLYYFYLNSELIDVNNRFRIFEYNNKTYVIKRTKKKDGLDENYIANTVKKLLDGEQVNGFLIKIVEPQLVCVGENYYIVTEYYGETLQECCYSNEIVNKLSLDDLIDILNLMMSKGIMYRGFLPRNTIINRNIVYLLDWEDAVIKENNNEVSINRLWETNFILNWGYLYDPILLKDKIKKYKKNDIEPDLLKYETKFKNIIHSNDNNSNLRTIIMNVVLYAERKVKIEDDEFCIPPNDLAHLISDIFNTDVDVIFDLICFYTRKHDEEKYIKCIKKISSSIIYSFKNKLNLQNKILPVIFEMIDININGNYKDNLIKTLNYIISEITNREIENDYENLIEYIDSIV